MKSSLKLFCIVLMSAGLLLPACEKKQEAVEEEGAVEVAAEEEALEEEAAEEEAVEEEEAAEEEAVEGDATEEAEGDAVAEEAGEEAAEEAPAEAKAEKPKPATPALVGRVNGTFGGSGVKNGKIDLTVAKDYKVNGTISGEKEGVNVRIPFRGTLSKDNKINATGKSGNSNVTVTGDVRATGATVKLSGQINGKPLDSMATITK